MQTARRPTELANLHVRWMIRRDMPEVFAIERAAFEYPWDEGNFLRVLRERNCIGQIAEAQVGDETRVVGYYVYAMERRRLEVLNFAVDPWFWRLGVGAAMMDKLKGKLGTNNRSRMVMYVGERSLGAQLFLRAQAWLATGVERGFFTDSGEDGYRMEYRIK